MTALEKAQNLLAGAEACLAGSVYGRLRLVLLRRHVLGSHRCLGAFRHQANGVVSWRVTKSVWVGMHQKSQGFPERFGDYLTRGYRLRCRAHYERDEVSRKEAERLLRQAQEFVKAMKEVIKR